MTGVRTLTVAEDEADLRLDRWFRRRFPALRHGRLERLLRTGQVRVDGRRARAGTRLAAGQSVRVPPLPEAPGAPAPPVQGAPPSGREAEALRRSVLFMDDWVIAIDKPPGLAVQGGTGQFRYLDAMLGALSLGRAEPPRLVHRLDRDTSGVLLLARSAPAARKLTAAFKGKAAQKVYWALVAGVPEPRRGRIDLPLAKRPGQFGERMRADELLGKPAETLYRVVEERSLGPDGGRVAWLVLMPLTGRTHQLRAHCAALGVPILGDAKYGGTAALPEALVERIGGGAAGRLMLHAREIAVPHPEDETTLRVAAPLPPHMAAAWAAFGLDEAKADDAAADLISYAQGLTHSPPGARPARRGARRTGHGSKP